MVKTKLKSLLCTVKKPNKMFIPTKLTEHVKKICLCIIVFLIPKRILKVIKSLKKFFYKLSVCL